MTNQSLGSPSAHVTLNLAVFQATCCLLAEATAVEPDHASDTSFICYTTRIGLYIFDALTVVITIMLLTHVLPLFQRTYIRECFVIHPGISSVT